MNKKEQQLSIQTYSRSANQKKLDAIVDKLLSSFKKHIKSNFKNSSDRTTTSFNP
ncbi:MAG: hypothetical protein MJ219_01005 [Mycoplasmoidaceae bacterium]|nr:hypothetical protein [Mycoplasmoidaceae bacterium]